MSSVAMDARRPKPAQRGHVTAPILTVDPEAIAHNTRHFARLAPQLMAVVKADGYGHGAATVARIALANGATSLGVATAEEALSLRVDGVSAPLLAWVLPVDAPWDDLAWWGVDVAVGSIHHLGRAVAAASATRTSVRVHLHVDCGMAREGAPRAQWPELFASARAAERAGVVEVVGLMGHLAVPSQPGGDVRGERLFHEAFAEATHLGLRPRHRHLAATAATFASPSARHTLCRVGAGLVGIDPVGGQDLHEASTLTAPVIAVRRVDAGDSTGYGHDWTAARPTQLATLAVGYADGIPRAAAGRAHVAWNGRRMKAVGAISMDQTVVDVGDASIEPGDTVTVWGSTGPSVSEWAAWADTIPHEILTGLGARVRKTVAP